MDWNKTMTTLEKMIKMYEAVNGEIYEPHRNRFEPSYPLNEYGDEMDYEEPIGIKYVKDGHTCFEIAKTDLMFDYLTLGW